jgi:hypothetical protein
MRNVTVDVGGVFVPSKSTVIERRVVPRVIQPGG